MPKPAAPEARGVALLTLAAVTGITAVRVALLAATELDLFVDEAQYWLWGQELAFGYYSKPPLIGWVIAATTTLAGSDAPFWVRLPAPLFHGATALILGALAGRLFEPRAGLATALAYATLPMVAVGALLISTDTIMFPFLAAALLGYVGCLRRGGGVLALGTGAALGLAFLAKYAAIYYLLCAVLAACFVPRARPRLSEAALCLAAFLLVAAPNIVWNLRNGLATLQHTADNAGWVRGLDMLQPGALATFFMSQFAVFGPVLFATLLFLALRLHRRIATERILLLFSIPVVALICGQALLSGAYANWAAAAYLAGTTVTVPLLAARARPLLALSFVLNGALAVAVPLAATMPERLRHDGEPLLSRYLGLDEMSRAILSAADRNGFDTIVARDRDILADLFYTGRDSPIAIYAVPEAGRAPHHYALTFPLPAGVSGRLLYVSDSRTPPACTPGRAPVESITGEGAYAGDSKHLFAVPANCWRDGER